MKKTKWAYWVPPEILNSLHIIILFTCSARVWFHGAIRIEISAIFQDLTVRIIFDTDITANCNYERVLYSRAHSSPICCFFFWLLYKQKSIVAANKSLMQLTIHTHTQREKLKAEGEGSGLSITKLITHHVWALLSLAHCEEAWHVRHLEWLFDMAVRSSRYQISHKLTLSFSLSLTLSVSLYLRQFGALNYKN